MKTLLTIVAISAIALCLPLTAQQKGAAKGKGKAAAVDPNAPEVPTYVPADQVANALANSGLLVSGKDHTVIGAHRDAGPGQPESHANATDIYYIVDGAATFVTGGTYTDARETRPGELIGGTLTGGEEHQLKKGDVMVIPPGIPHWYKEVPNEVSYYLIKVLRP